MSTRTLYLVRHGLADALGQLTDHGREQSTRIGKRLAQFPIDVIWHSPLPRAIESARLMANEISPPLLDEAPELVDNVPFVPEPSAMTPAWRGFFDGFDQQEAERGRAIADAMTARFGRANRASKRSTHEVLVTHAYPIAWFVRHALGAEPARWMSLAGVDNASLTVIQRDHAELPDIHMFNDLSHLN